ncbi:MAG: dynamin family protein [Kiritimatiellae bacterium]|nr:dynamin family protein [Kiritimatiellia bacterium]
MASDIRAFLSETPFSSHIPELDAAVATFQRAVFHVAIVGEFSRGKSTFLNELIGNGPLPVGDLPTTAIPARIAGGRVNKVLFRSKGQPPREIPFSQEALDAFSAADDGKDPEGSLDVSVAESWLQSLPVVFFDTPGVGDAIGKRADLARAVIAGCDCTVVVVAASSPCSLTELAFLRDGVVARKVPRVAVLVTKLDLVPEKERARVIDYVRDRIRTVAPEAETWVARLTPGIDLDSAHCVGVEAIRRRISDMCSEPDVVARRRMQLIGSLENVLTAVSEDLATREKAIGLSREKRAEAQQKLEANQKHFELLWDEILVECDTGTACLEQWVASELNSVRDSLIEDFIHSLRNCPDAKLRQWAEEEFPYRAKREIPRRIREQFQPKLLTKLGQLAQETTRLAKERFSVSGLDFTFTPEPAPESGTIGDLKADDRAIRRIQTGATIVKVAAVPIAMLGLILVGGPMGIAYALGSAGALGGGFLAGKKAEAKAAELRAVLERGVKEEIGRVFKEQSNSARELVQKAYGQLQAAIKSKMRIMLDEGLKALNESLESSIDATGINALRGRLETLRERLSTATHG